jgi:hypothetical protein
MRSIDYIAVNKTGRGILWSDAVDKGEFDRTKGFVAYSQSVRLHYFKPCYNSYDYYCHPVYLRRIPTTTTAIHRCYEIIMIPENVPAKSVAVQEMFVVPTVKLASGGGTHVVTTYPELSLH